MKKDLFLQTPHFFLFILVENVVSTSTADVVFVVDSSGSIGKCHYELMMNFVVDVCNSFTISPEGVRVGLVAFSTDSKAAFSLGDKNSAPEVTETIQNLPYQSGGTNTHLGLDDLRQMMITYGRPGNTGVPRFAIVLTDGQ